MVSHAAALTGEEGSEWSHRSCIVVRNAACAFLYTARQLDAHLVRTFGFRYQVNLEGEKYARTWDIKVFVIKLAEFGILSDFGYTGGK